MIQKKHLEDGSKGELSEEELLQLGNIIRNGTIRESAGKNVYELNVDGVKFTAVTGSTKNGKERVITYYSDRNLEVDAHSKGAITSTTSNEKIITYNEELDSASDLKLSKDIKQSAGGFFIKLIRY